MVTISFLQCSQPEQRALQSGDECSTAVQLLHSKTRSSSSTSVAWLWTLAPSLGPPPFSLDLLLCGFAFTNPALHQPNKPSGSMPGYQAELLKEGSPSAKISRTGRCGGGEWWPSATLAKEKKGTTPGSSQAIQSALLHPYGHFGRVPAHLLTQASLRSVFGMYSCSKPLFCINSKSHSDSPITSQPLPLHIGTTAVKSPGSVRTGCLWQCQERVGMEQQGLLHRHYRVFTTALEYPKASTVSWYLWLGGWRSLVLFPPGPKKLPFINISTCHFLWLVTIAQRLNATQLVYIEIFLP